MCSDKLFCPCLCAIYCGNGVCLLESAFLGFPQHGLHLTVTKNNNRAEPHVLLIASGQRSLNPYQLLCWPNLCSVT